MSEIFIDVDTAVIVPVNILPLTDDTDFKTIETAIVYNSAGMALTWNFVTSAGVVTGTAVTPTTAGVYDWSEPIADKGMYAIEIPASGGVSINNDTEGYGWFSGVCTGVLPWRSPIICFRASGINDKMCDSAYDSTRGLAGTALPAAAAEAAGGLYTRGTGAGQIAQDANGNCRSNIDTIKTQAVTCSAGVTVLASVGTAATSTAQTGDSYALANGANGFVATKADTAAILLDTGTDGVVVVTNNDKTGYTIAAGGIAIGSFSNNSITDAASATDFETAIANAVKALVVESQGSYTIAQAISIILSAVAGVTSSGGATLKTADGVATRIAATIDGSNNRTAMTLTPSA